MLATVVKRISFEAGHHLPGYEGKCKSPHGHHFVVQLGVTAPINEITGMVIDFTILKAFLQSEIHDKLDHKYLNDVPGLENPTAENVCRWILKAFSVSKPCPLQQFKFVRVWETPDSYAEL